MNSTIHPKELQQFNLKSNTFLVIKKFLYLVNDKASAGAECNNPLNVFYVEVPCALLITDNGQLFFIKSSCIHNFSMLNVSNFPIAFIALVLASGNHLKLP